MIILVHLGDDLPSHLSICYQQLRKFYVGPVRILVNKPVIQKENPTMKFVHIQDEEIESNFPILREFRSLPVIQNMGFFWRVTYERLFWIAYYMEREGIQTAIHIENDIMIYMDPFEAIKQAGIRTDNFGINIVGPDHAAFAAIHIGRKIILKELLARMIRVLWNPPNLRGQSPTEMVVLNYLFEEDCKERKFAQIFSVMPWNPMISDVVFDPASIGQFLFGTTDGIPGWYGDHHFIGELIRDKLVKFEWREIISPFGNTERVPYAISKNGKESKIASLHIHSKQLQKALSSPIEEIINDI